MKQFIVDRIEGKFAVCETEDGSVVNIELDSLPGSIAEGDILLYDGTTYSIDSGATEKKRQRILKKMDDLFKE